MTADTVAGTSISRERQRRCSMHRALRRRIELLTIYIDKVPRVPYLSRTRRPAAYNAVRSSRLPCVSPSPQLCLSVPQQLRDADRPPMLLLLLLLQLGGQGKR